MKKIGEPMGRRSFLLRTAGPAAGAAVLAAVGPEATRAAESRSAYTPSFFTPQEWDFVNAAVDRLIPAEGSGPGGLAAGVPEFIDRQLEMPYGHGAFAYMRGPFQRGLPETLGYQLPYVPRDLYRRGIAAAERACRAEHRLAFALLAAPLQDEFLAQMEAGRLHENDPPLQAFFAQLLENTREGYFADPMYGGNRDMGAWKAIGFPGARADFTDWIDQAGKPYPYGPVSINGARAR